MDLIDEFARKEYKRFADWLIEQIYNPCIILIVSSEQTPVGQFIELMASQPSIIKYKNDGPDFEPSNLITMEMKDKTTVFIEWNGSTKTHIEDVLEGCYYVLQKKGNFRPILVIDKATYYFILEWLGRSDISRHLIKPYHLGEVEESIFIAWFQTQFPCNPDMESIRIIYEGTGPDFEKALRVRDTFYDRVITRLFFLTEEDQKIIEGHFPMDRTHMILGTDAGVPLRMPVKHFLFDTSALASTQLIPFIKHVNKGTYTIPPFIVEELHRLEERKKHEGDSSFTSRIKRNMDFLNIVLTRRVWIDPKQTVRFDEIDNVLVKSVAQARAILVTADGMILRDCRELAIPIVFFHQ
jgi:rRNA-processing protein FCF1